MENEVEESGRIVEAIKALVYVIETDDGYSAVKGPQIKQVKNIKALNDAPDKVRYILLRSDSGTNKCKERFKVNSELDAD